MKSALVAVGPTSQKGHCFERFCELVRFFQAKGFFSETSVASIIHASLYAVPFSWYREMSGEFAEEAQESVEAACQGRFAFDSVKILESETHANESLVTQISRFGRRTGKDLLIVLSNERTGLPHWILGSFSETAALTASLPVLVMKPHTRELDLSKSARFVVAVDVAAPLSSKDLRWITKAAKLADSHVDLVYVEPRPRPVIESLQKRREKGEASLVLKKMQRILRSEGVETSAEILTEGKTIAHTIAEFAEKRKAWMTITVGAKRSLARKLLLGSTARRLLSLTERPFLSLRLE